jgi:hypothetical protein
VVVTIVDVVVVVSAGVVVAVVGAAEVEEEVAACVLEVETELVEHAERRRSVAIAAPRRLNDRQEPPSPFISRHGLTGLPPTSVAPPNIPMNEPTCGKFPRGRITPV